MLFTPAYIFTILLGIWVLSLAGCIALGIYSYRLVMDRRRLRARLEEANMLLAGSRRSDPVEGTTPVDTSLPLLSPDPNREPDASSPGRN